MTHNDQIQVIADQLSQIIDLKIELRDQFAASALIGLLGSDRQWESYGEVVAAAYQMADVMLTVRLKEVT